ncbi:hypothetical protein PFLU4_37650 [Pseudomonas fluorescens]|nr:hypothetical protein PFLU4_37650 [Pseudomonas fluorescens]
MAVTADLRRRHLQQLGPQGSQLLFGGAAGWIEGVWRGLDVRGRQGLAVEFAVVGQWQLIEQYECRGHHVVGQGGANGFAPGMDVGLLVARHIGDQALVAGHVFTGQHHGLAHARLGTDQGFYFPQLDTETTDLHLMIHASQVFELAVGQPAHQVTGLVHPCPGHGGERVFDEHLRGLLGAVEVAQGHAGTADVQFPRDAHRHRVEEGIEHVGAHVGDGPADDWPQREVIHRATSGIHRAFGWAVGVEEAAAGNRRQALPQLCVHRIATEQHEARQVHLATPNTVAFEQGLELCRGTFEGVQAGVAEESSQGLRVVAHVFRGQVQAVAVEQQDQLGHRTVEGERVVEAGTHRLVGVAAIQAMDTRPGQVDHRTVGHQGALGLTGRTGGVHDVGQVLRPGERGRVAVRLVGEQGCVAVQAQARQFGAQLFQQALLAEQQCRLRVFEHVRQAIHRVGRVQRHIGATGLENAQQADQQFQRALDTQRHRAVGADAPAAQVMRHLVGAPVEFAVAQAAAFEAQGVTLRGAFGLLFEQLGEGQVRWHRHLGAVPLDHGALPFGVHQQRQGGDRALGLGEHVFEQMFQARQGLAGAVGDEQIEGEHQLQLDRRIGRAQHVQVQVAFGMSQRRVQRFECQPGEAQP